MDFQLLGRCWRKWRRKRRRVGPAGLPEPFHHAADILELQRIFATSAPDPETTAKAAKTISGECYVCNEIVGFEVAPAPPGGTVNWRETLSCPNCGLINRWRSCIHLFEAVCEPDRRDRIYLTETLSPVYETLARRYPLLTGSEYLPHAKPGEILEIHGKHVRNEDVTRLSFGDRMLEAILCFDVLEHVPDYRQALREFFRVLDTGGQLLLSVPFSFQQETVVRAVVSGAGTIEHLVEPCYHGDPLSAEGVLSYYDFGMDLLAEMTRAGFSETFLVCYQSARWGYCNANVAFVARRLEG